MNQEETKEEKEKQTQEESGQQDMAEDVPEEESTASEKPKEEPKEDPLQTRLLRLQADFDNFRKRTQKEKAAWSNEAREKVLLDVIEIVDHFSLGLDNAEKHEAKGEVLEGFRMVFDQVQGILKRYGVEEVSTKEAAFDPNMHEAISFMPSDDLDEGCIVYETRKGYLMGKKLLRAAQVVVSSGKPAESKENEPEEK